MHLLIRFGLILCLALPVIAVVRGVRCVGVRRCTASTTVQRAHAPAAHAGSVEGQRSYLVAEQQATLRACWLHTHELWQGGAGGCGVLKIGLTKNGLQLGHGLLRELGDTSLRHCDT